MLRRSIYVVFVVVTVLIVGFAGWYHASRGKADTWVPEGLDKAMRWVVDLIPFGDKLYEYLIRPFFIYPVYAALALGLMMIFYLASRFARMKLRNTFAQFWRKKLPKPWW